MMLADENFVPKTKSPVALVAVPGNPTDKDVANWIRKTQHLPWVRGCCLILWRSTGGARRNGTWRQWQHIQWGVAPEQAVRSGLRGFVTQ